MSQRTAWTPILLAGLLLLLIGAVAVTLDIVQFRSAVRSDLREGCREVARTFEEFAERSIVRDQPGTLDALARFLLIGQGLYVDVVFQGERLFSGRDDGFDDPVDDLVLNDAPSAATSTSDLAGGHVEVMLPLIFDGLPERPLGEIRVGFSGDAAAAKVWAHGWRVTGLGAGAWGLVMALAALAMWRRTRSCPTETKAESVLCCGTLEIDTIGCCATLNDVALDLTPKLYELLLAFARRPGSILSDQDLLDAVWADSTYAASPDVKQHIYLLRRKLKAAHPDPKAVIVNVKGFGYRLDTPVNEEALSGD